MALPKNKRTILLKTTGISLICVSILTGGIYTLSEKRGNNNIKTTSTTKKSMADKKKEIVDKVLDSNEANQKQSILDKVTKDQSEETTSRLFEQAISGNYQKLSRDIIANDLIAFNEPKKENGGQQQLVSTKPKEDKPKEDKPKEDKPTNEEETLPVIPIEPNNPVEPNEPVKPPLENPTVPIVIVDYSVLESEYQKSLTIDLSLYLSFSIEHFSHEMLVSERLLSDKKATQIEVDNQVERLRQAVDALILKGDKTELKRVIRKAERINKELYTNESYNQLDLALKQGKAVVASDEVSQETVDIARGNIQDALENLVRISEIEEEKLSLRQLVTTAEALQPEDYTETSWLLVEDALTNANNVLSSEEATVEMVVSARTTLEQAIEKLELKVTNDIPKDEEPQELTHFSIEPEIVLPETSIVQALKSKESLPSETDWGLEENYSNAKEIESDVKESVHEGEVEESTNGLVDMVDTTQEIESINTL